MTLSLKASAKVAKAAWKSKLKTLVAPRVGNRPSRGKTCSRRWSLTHPSPHQERCCPAPTGFFDGEPRDLCNLGAEALKLFATIDRWARLPLRRSRGHSHCGLWTVGAVASYPTIDARAGRPKGLLVVRSRSDALSLWSRRAATSCSNGRCGHEAADLNRGHGGSEGPRRRASWWKTSRSPSRYATPRARSSLRKPPPR